MTPPTHTHTEFELLQVFRLKFCGGRPKLSLNSEKVTCTSLAGEGVKVARSPLDRCHQLFFPLRCSSVAAFTILQSLDSPKGIFPNHSSKYFEVRRNSSASTYVVQTLKARAHPPHRKLVECKLTFHFLITCNLVPLHLPPLPVAISLKLYFRKQFGAKLFSATEMFCANWLSWQALCSQLRRSTEK